MRGDRSIVQVKWAGYNDPMAKQPMDQHDKPRFEAEFAEAMRQVHQPSEEESRRARDYALRIMERDAAIFRELAK